MKKSILLIAGILISFFSLSQEMYDEKTNETESEINKTGKINIDEYGGRFSYGVAIGGGGIVGIPVKAVISPKFAMELGAFYRPAIVVNSTGSFSSILFAGGPSYIIERHYKSHKQKVKLNGVGVKSGIGFGDFTTYLFGAAWIHESFKERNKNRSFTFELGPGLLITDNFPSGYYEYNESSFAIYWKLMWSLYSK